MEWTFSLTDGSNGESMIRFKYINNNNNYSYDIIINILHKLLKSTGQ